MSRRRPPTLAELAVVISGMPDGPDRAHLEALYWAKSRPPTLAELAVVISGMPDGPDRAHLEALYWAKSLDHHGVEATYGHRADYEWLRRRARRLEEMRRRPSIGAFRQHTVGRAA